MEDHHVKNLDCPEANQLTIYKHGRGFELRTTKNKSSKQTEWDLNSGPPNCKSSTLTAWPLCLLYVHTIYEKTKVQITVRPALGKQNIKLK